MIARRSLIAAGLGACLLARVRPSAASPASRTVLQLGFLTSSASPMGRGAAAFATSVSRLTEGSIRIDCYPNAGLAVQDDLLRMVLDGSLDMAFLTGTMLGTFMPQLRIFDVPFLFRDVAHARAVMDGSIGQELLASLAAQQVVGLAWGENGLRHLTTSKRPVRAAADLAGMKIRVPPSEAMQGAFKALGAEPKPLPIADVFAALSDGSFDGQENPIETMLASRLQLVQRYVTLTAHNYSPALLVMSKRAFDRLVPEDRARVQEAAQAATKASREQVQIDERANVKRLQGLGLQVIEDCDRASFQAGIAGAEPIFVKLFGKERLQAIRNIQAS